MQSHEAITLTSHRIMLRDPVLRMPETWPLVCMIACIAVMPYVRGLNWGYTGGALILSVGVIAPLFIFPIVGALWRRREIAQTRLSDENVETLRHADSGLVSLRGTAAELNVVLRNVRQPQPPVIVHAQRLYVTGILVYCLIVLVPILVGDRMTRILFHGLPWPTEYRYFLGGALLVGVILMPIWITLLISTQFRVRDGRLSVWRRWWPFLQYECLCEVDLRRSRVLVDCAAKEILVVQPGVAEIPIPMLTFWRPLRLAGVIVAGALPDQGAPRSAFCIHVPPRQ